MENIELKYRCLARFIVEAETPLMIGSGENDILTDQLVMKDMNGLPYIPGTALTGVLRQMLVNELQDDNVVNNLFGFQKGTEGYGSRIIFSEARIVGENKKIADGLALPSETVTSVLKTLPIRQHVLITANGSTKKGCRFDEEIVYKGTRFCFEVEFIANRESEKDLFVSILSNINKDSFRIGGNTRKGFGQLSVIESKITRLDLSKEQDLKSYVEKTSSLNDPFWDNIKSEGLKEKQDDFESINIAFKAKDFLLLGSGFGNENADITPMIEDVLIWENEIPKLESFFVIPGTSIKGTLAHRTTFHYLLKRGDSLEDLFKNSKSLLNEEPLCKKELFGSTKDEVSVGNVFIPDIYIPCNKSFREVQPHVVIDAFTGGAVKGKLFQEELLCTNQALSVNIQIANKEYSLYVKDAFLKAIEDFKNGMLPLGAATTRGHGTFQAIKK